MVCCSVASCMMKRGVNSERPYTRPWGPQEITRLILTEDEEPLKYL